MRLCAIKLCRTFQNKLLYISLVCRFSKWIMNEGRLQKEMCPIPRRVRAFLGQMHWFVAPVGLRQDYASTSATATASRRSSSFSLHTLRRSQMDLEEEDEEDEGYDQLPPPQPRLFRTGSMQRGSLPHSHTFSSFRDCRRSSTTHQFSLSGHSQYSGPSSLITETQTAYTNSTGEWPDLIWEHVW